MRMRTVSGFGVCLGVSLFAVVAWGQTGNDGVVTINGGRNVISIGTPSRSFTPAVPVSSKLVKIYDNLGTGKNVYNGNAGVGILGPDTGQPWPQSVGCGFRPKANHVVTEIQVGAAHVQGTNTLVVSLNEDDNGIPGKALHTWYFSNLPVFGQCCVLQTAKYAAGIKVTKGKLYWVVLSPQKKYGDTYDVWDNNFAGLEGTWSNNIGSGWSSSYQELGAFAVYGK